MQWLPAIPFQNAGWLLPLSSDTAQVLANLIYDTSDQHGPLADVDIACETLCIQLSKDPALAIFSLVELLARHPESAAKSFSLEEHASWFGQIAAELFLDRNRQMLTGQLATKLELESENSSSFEQFRCLAAQTLAEPLDSWIDYAGQWFSVTGQAPSKSWLEQLPRLESQEDESQEDESQEDESSNLESPNADSPDINHMLQVASLGYGQASVDLYRIARNQNELRSLRQRFSSKLQAEKMASLRQLAYGLSHEINNPLASIRTRAEQLMLDERQQRRRDQLQRIVDSVMRSHEMIADMMYFAKPPKPQTETVDPWELTQVVVQEFQQDALRHDIELKAAAELSSGNRQPPRKMTILCDPHQIGDALRALVRNSIEAIGQRGSISVMVQANGRRINWTVTDSGPGLTPEASRHAFDPYFSGREAGRGLGLGLCRVYRVARAHGGGASIEHTEVGCRARMWVPTKLRTAASD